jgi:uncharacterized protein YecE (DUF72 family)
MAEILLGTCGWSYAEWEGVLYPQKQTKLKQYSSIFPTTEIDSTFYSLPKQEIVLGWARHTPSNFIFSAKLPQTITHKKALDVARGIEADLNQFIETMNPLIDARKLACVLVQLPPFLRFNAERFESFLSILPDTPRFAVEFRHDSWLNDETLKMLEKYQVTYTIVDEPLLPPDIHVTSDLAYIRWHGRGERPWFNYKYSQEQLAEWIPRVQETASKAQKVLGYFNNHFHGYAPENCLQTMQMLGIVTPHGDAALRRVSFYRTHGRAPDEAGTLETWTGPVRAKEIEDLLVKFGDAEMLERARVIPDDDLSLREDSKRRLAAYVADTTVDIDFEERTIVHRCPAWSVSVSEKRFCPHLVKLFLSINHEKSSKILSLVQSTLDSWKFESRLAVEFPA